MPDIDFQKIVLNLIPKREDDPVVFYASQYETTRRFIADLMWGDTEFAPGPDYWAEIDIRKNDDNLVVITDDVTIDNNEVSVILPVQAVTCIGKNLGQVKIYAGEDQFVAAFNFILEVQPDPLAGGVTSETAIDNLTQQIEDITQEVIGNDYYNKTETDALLADKADVSDLPDMTNYYTKTQADNLLNDKADRSDLATLASKAEVTQAISDEDTALKNWVSSNFVTPGYVATHYYDKTEVDNLIDNIYPTLTASGGIASFTTALNKPLVSVTAEAGATIITRCGVNLCNTTLTSESRYDVDFTVNADKSITVNGTASDTFILNITHPVTLREIGIRAGVDYFLSGCPAGGSGSTYRIQFSVSGSGTEPKDFGNGVVCNFSESDLDKTYQIIFYINGGTLLDNLTFYPQLVIGSTAEAYEAYNGQTVPVADATTLTTLSGVNNVFADDGDVTVQYKYMSI